MIRQSYPLRKGFWVSLSRKSLTLLCLRLNSSCSCFPMGAITVSLRFLKYLKRNGSITLSQILSLRIDRILVKLTFHQGRGCQALSGCILWSHVSTHRKCKSHSKTQAAQSLLAESQQSTSHSLLLRSLKEYLLKVKVKIRSHTQIDSLMRRYFRKLLVGLALIDRVDQCMVDVKDYRKSFSKALIYQKAWWLSSDHYTTELLKSKLTFVNLPLFSCYHHVVVCLLMRLCFLIFLTVEELIEFMTLIIYLIILVLRLFTQSFKQLKDREIL